MQFFIKKAKDSARSSLKLKGSSSDFQYSLRS